MDLDIYLTEKHPLHVAARDGRRAVLESLLDSKKFDVNAATFDLVRPLHEACLAGQYECAKLLIKFGADVNLSNIDGATALCDACSNGCIRCVQLLLENGANVNPFFLFTTPAHECVFKGHWACLQKLLEYGADPDKSDCHFGTPLHVAVFKDEVVCGEVLLQAGANPNVSKTHVTPLHIAARSQNLDFIRLLLNYGADPYAQDGHNLTALQQIPSSSSPCRDLLQEWETTPKSLRHHCRLRIRAALGRKRLKCTSELRLPKILLQFLQHSA